MTENSSLKEQIDGLAPDQAQEAALSFYELLPKEWWTDQKKLPTANIEIRADLLREKAQAEIKPLLDKLTSEGNEPLKAEVAKALLLEFSQYEPVPHYKPFLDYVEKAVTRAKEPHMAIVPAFAGAYLIVLVLLPTMVDIEKKEDGFKIHLEFGNLKEIANFTDKLKQMLDRILPPDIWGGLK